MQVQKILNTSGEWFINIASFGFVDPTNGNRFDPQIPTKADATDWVKSQDAVIKPWVDPTNGEAEKAEAAAAAEAAKAEAEKLAAEEAAKAAEEASTAKAAEEAAAAEAKAAEAKAAEAAKAKK